MACIWRFTELIFENFQYSAILYHINPLNLQNLISKSNNNSIIIACCTFGIYNDDTCTCTLNTCRHLHVHVVIIPSPR